MAEVLAFPPARQVDLIRRQAWHMSNRSQADGEAFLARQIKIQRQRLVRLNVDAPAIDRAIAGYEGAIRGEVWRLVMQTGHQA